MDVRRLARCASFIAALAMASVGCRGTREAIEDMDWSWPRSAPASQHSGINRAQLWEDGYGFNNPNGPKIRNGTKKPGDKPSKDNPYYEDEERERRERESNERAERKKIRFEEPKFDWD